MKLNGLKDLKNIDGRFHGKINLPSGSEVQLVFDLELEKEVADVNDFTQIVESYKDFLADLRSGERLEYTLAHISKEITDASYSQSDYTPITEDYEKLKNDFRIVKINFYQEDLVFELTANETFKDMTIFCQIDRNWEVEDVNVG
ncbi:MAG: hypothetical protein P8P74_05595 [Crocinitomicaceae bacterium]|nr:hypothetical protein [Crocinitomicaceae bacterium]